MDFHSTALIVTTMLFSLCVALVEIGSLSSVSTLYSTSFLNELKTAIDLKSGKHVNMYYIDDVMCKGPGGGLSLGVQRLDGGRFHLTISGYQGQNGETHYMSSEAGNAAYGGSLAVRKSVDASCHLTIEKMYVLSPATDSFLNHCKGCITTFMESSRCAIGRRTT